jgi:hypothetical protein
VSLSAIEIFRLPPLRLYVEALVAAWSPATPTSFGHAAVSRVAGFTQANFLAIHNYVMGNRIAFQVVGKMPRWQVDSPRNQSAATASKYL